jgi:hypothetical protein
MIEQDRAISNPVGLITDLIAAADPSLAPDRIRSAVVAVAGGRAKSRRLDSRRSPDRAMRVG